MANCTDCGRPVEACHAAAFRAEMGPTYNIGATYLLDCLRAQVATLRADVRAAGERLASERALSDALAGALKRCTDWIGMDSLDERDAFDAYSDGKEALAKHRADRAKDKANG